MLNMLFILVALVLFTIGFRLVKRGTPYTRRGGDTYTKRRMRRMLGWMMWTTAGVLVMLTLIDQILTGPPEITTLGANPTAAKPGTSQIPTAKFSTQFMPNLIIHSLALQANGAEPGGATKAPDLSLASVPSQQHLRSMIPTLMKPLADDSAAGGQSADIPRQADTANQFPPTGPGAGNTQALPPPIPLPSDANGQGALAAVNNAIQLDPTNILAYIQRGNIYATQKKWDQAKEDFIHALHINNTCKPAAFGIAEIEFLQAHYDAARSIYLQLEQDPDYGDLAKYRAFLCDLFGGHQDEASREFAVFNQAGSEASYYFANVAWSLYHKKPGDAQNWWQSAVQIFAPDKVQVYARPLIALGYIKVES
jgi:tetratricopeptide (TPR) repeat protein